MEQKENKSKNTRQTEPRRNAQGEDLSQYIFGKVQPQALQLEEVVLGALMLDREALPNVMDILKPDSFYLEAHQHIYRSIIKLFERSHPVDLLTVTEELRSQGLLEKIGGAYTLVELTNRVASAANIEYHARIIAQKAMQRALISVSTRTIEDAYKDTTDVFNLLDEAEKGLFNITQNNLTRSYQSMGPLSSMVLKNLEELSKKEDGLTGVPTGFLPLDRLTSGWQPSDLIILAARPGMGKCLGKGTQVLMYDGSLKKVEEVVVGDLLMGDDSTPRRVLSLARGRERMYHVRQNKGMDYRVNESHILSLKRSRNEGPHRHGDVLNISVRDYLAKGPKFQSNYKGYKVEVAFREQKLQLHPYFLGLWLGDGTTTKNEIATTEVEVVSWLDSFADSLRLTLKNYENTPNKCPRYGITGGYTGNKGYSLLSELRSLGVVGNKHIPQQYLINSTANRLQLLAGLIDSDGHLLVQSNGLEITQKSKFLAEQIKFLCDSLGFRTSLAAKKASIRAIGYETEVYRIRIYGDIDRIPVKVKRKKPNTWKSPVDWHMTGIQVEYDKVDDYYGFEIDGNKLFLLADMTVTHNTSFVLACALNAAMKFNKPVALFSLEMANVQLVQRLISMESEIEGSKMRNGKLADYEWQRLQDTVDKLSNVPIFIDDTPGINIFELRAKCRRLKMRENIQLVIIDYLQLMSGNMEANKNTNREQEISNISRALKGMAKELSVPVIALSQLSRAVETRGGTKRPQLSDLRECLTGDTWITLADGRHVRLAHLVGQNVEVISVNAATQTLAESTTELVWESGVKPVYLIKLASGRQIKATGNHKLFGFNGWVTCESLKIGDRLAIARSLPEPKIQTNWDDQKLILLGHLIGDGSYLKGQPLRYTTASEANSKAVTEAAESFGVTVHRHKGKGNWHQLVFSGNGNRWAPKGINLWLRTLGVFNQRSSEKVIPDEIFTLSNCQIAFFLKHLWATDGTLFVPKSTTGRSACKIAFSTNSDQLARGVASLLLRFSIVARIKTVKQGKYKPMFSVEISGAPDQKRFIEHIGAFGDKISNLAAIELWLAGKVPNTNTDTLPPQIFEVVKANMREQGVSQRKMAEARGTSYGGSSHFSFAPSRSLISESAHHLNLDELTKWANSDLFWDSITSIEPAGEELVYDMTVPNHHAFLANGIVSHNSGAIEQDADIVSFIFRPEYYGMQEDDEGRSTKGVAEIIIAKHRNGALDTARLRFTDKFARFEDLPDENFAGLSDLAGPFTPDVVVRPSRMNDEDIPF